MPVARDILCLELGNGTRPLRCVDRETTAERPGLVTGTTADTVDIHWYLHARRVIMAWLEVSQGRLWA